MRAPTLPGEAALYPGPLPELLPHSPSCTERPVRELGSGHPTTAACQGTVTRTGVSSSLQRQAEAKGQDGVAGCWGGAGRPSGGPWLCGHTSPLSETQMVGRRARTACTKVPRLQPVQETPASREMLTTHLISRHTPTQRGLGADYYYYFFWHSSYHYYYYYYYFNPYTLQIHSQVFQKARETPCFPSHAVHSRLCPLQAEEDRQV